MMMVTRRIHIPALLLISFSLLLLGLTGCRSSMTTAELDRLHQEAVAENDRLTQLNANRLSKNWKVVIQGEVNQSLTLDWNELERLATTELTTHNPYSDNPKVPTKYQGIALQTILDRAGAKAGAKSITVVAADAFYNSMPLNKALKDKGLLAIRENGKPIPRSPPSTPQVNDNQAWAYYTTHIVIGSEPLRLKVGEKTFNRFELEKLPATTINTLVGYKIGWDSNAVKLTGVKLTTLLKHQKLDLSDKAIVKIRRKAMTPNEPQKFVEVSADLLNSCDVILAYRWGNDAQNIPGLKGGPLTLAYGKNCTSDQAKDLAWLPFVESISIEPIAPQP
jgi:DMSO/TMAO reductase YedYZ molybdopterin-dependent catalytic subunit